MHCKCSLINRKCLQWKPSNLQCNLLGLNLFLKYQKSVCVVKCRRFFLYILSYKSSLSPFLNVILRKNVCLNVHLCVAYKASFAVNLNVHVCLKYSLKLETSNRFRKLPILLFSGISKLLFSRSLKLGKNLFFYFFFRNSLIVLPTKNIAHCLNI